MELADIRGDFQCRTDAGGGRDGLEALVAAARKRKLGYIVIADPCRRVASANRLDPDALARQDEAHALAMLRASRDPREGTTS